MKIKIKVYVSELVGRSYRNCCSKRKSLTLNENIEKGKICFFKNKLSFQLRKLGKNSKINLNYREG
jgi:hypothetical protein